MADITAGQNVEKGAGGGLFHNWRYVLATTNPPKGHLDPVSKWLYLTRAGVLPMTLVSGAVAGLLAVYRSDDVAWGWFALALAGIVGAHMANNLMNDLFDLGVGTDREDYPRNLYSPHPVLSGVITRKGLAACALVVNLICLAIMVVLTVAQGWPIVAFALGGFVLSAAYTAPPLRLKKHGLGEPTVLVVWGPLMVGGTYYAATGHIPGAVILASLPYALLCTTVLMGKHIDKIPWDAADGTHTLPVILGEARARRVTQGMFVIFYLAIIALVIAQVLPVASLVVLGSLPMLRQVMKAYSEPKPKESPRPNPVWPLWFAALSFLVTRRASSPSSVGSR
jgi:1,4-dihydroxy-2-naphthoate polyprenyltransferase